MTTAQDVVARLQHAGASVRITGAAGSSGALLVTQVGHAKPAIGQNPVVVLTANETRAQAFARDVRFFLAEGSDAREEEFGDRAVEFPAPDTSPYAEVAPSAGVEGARLAVLFRLAHGLGPEVLTVGVEAALRRVLPRDAFEARCHHVAKGEEIGRDEFASRLTQAGYERVAVVEDAGTFAVRGAVLDLYCPLYPYPTRLEWDGDHVEAVRLFDPTTQRTLRRLPDLFVHPARETLKTGTRLRERIVQAADDAGAPSSRVRELVERLEGGQMFLGLHGYLPALHDHMATLFDYLPKGALLVVEDPAATAEAARDHWELERDAFATRRQEGAIVLPPEEHMAAIDWANRQRLEIDPLGGELDLGARPLDDLAAELKASRSTDDPLGPLRERLQRWKNESRRIVVQLSANTQAERLAGLLAARDCAMPTIQIGELGQGFVWDDRVVLAEQEIFGPHTKRRLLTRRDARSNLADLAPGDLIVHAEHGIGRTLGLVTLDVGGIRGDFLLLEYAAGHKLYLPVSRLSLVERYRGAEDNVRLDRLGGETFARRKQKATQDAQALAEELLQTYAQRRATAGVAHAEPDALFAEFEATFPFDETPDQARTITDVLADLTAPHPMDRLVCGDVGFGKTEVALRAAFLVASSGKQVAVLAPTTVLVEQHLRTFRERLAAWPLQVEGLSRFRSKREQATILRDLAAGRVDIAIGTHRLLQSDVRFRALGLIIVDEEHRFGVGHKERLKKMRASVDVLAMTATPIPRTLNLSLAGLRDLSLITTPPENRLSIRTLLCRTEDHVIRNAIRKELARGGQVFFVHNRIESIHEWVEKLRGLVPEAKLALAHGQMAACDLERVMVDFVSGAVDILVTTAIIESGLDIPRANSMLIHRADTLGLAQLYQLRGRIGRGRERAFCHLLIDSEAIAPNARKRLEAVLRHSDLGSGFALASTDLDIRGAGELLGSRQSGHVAALGFETYVRILEEAVAELKGEPIHRERDPDVTVDVPAYIPEAYVEDAGQRLDLYKRLAEARNEDAVRMVLDEMQDRYGPAPGEVETLGQLMICKALARGLGALTLEITRSRLALALGEDENSAMDPAKVATLVGQRGSGWKLTPEGRMSRNMPPDATDRLGFAKRVLQELGLCARSAAESAQIKGERKT